MADRNNLLLSTEESKSGDSWIHSWIINSPKHTSKQDKPEREVIAFSTGFEMLAESVRADEMGTAPTLVMKFLLPVMIILFVTANTLLCRAMYNISQWKFPPCFYVVILSSIDLGVNTVRLVDSWCQITFSVKFLNALTLTSDAVCSTFTISIYFLYHLTSMIRSALCIDLYYAFKCPLASNKKVIACRIEHLVLLFISVLLIFNSHFLWTYSLLHMNHKQTIVPPGNYCTYLVKWVSPTFRDVFWPMVDLVIGEICPMLSVLLSTALIVTQTHPHICRHLDSHSPSKTVVLSRHMIDVHAFIEMRKFILVYNLISFTLILLPSTITVIYKGFVYQKNHAMKMVTTFSTARSSTRSYVNPTDIFILNQLLQMSVVFYPIIVVLVGWNCSSNCFKKEILSFIPRAHRGRKINFLI